MLRDGGPSLKRAARRAYNPGSPAPRFHCMTRVSSALERLKLAVQYILPHHLLTRLVGRIAASQWRPLSRLVIRRFIAAYRPDMGEAVLSEPDRYPSFNAFFTRELKAGARTPDEDPAAILSPVDGVVSRTGIATGNELIQAKGLHYDLEELLGDAETASRFRDGAFATLYLSPRHYHRVHMPVEGELQLTRYVPGRLFSVAPFTVRGVPRLFCRNERLVCVFDTPFGAMAQILVGAMLVAGIETVWNGPYGHPGKPRHRTFSPGQVQLPAFAEMGRFNMGSTVILLFEPGRIAWRESLLAGDPVRLGERIGRHITGEARDR